MWVIAQEVEKVFPEIVWTSSDGSGGLIKTVEYGNLVAPLIEGVNELNDDINLLKKENEELRKRLDLLEKSISWTR